MKEQCICYSMNFMNYEGYEAGDKIVLPANQLYEFLSEISSNEPLTFRITTETGRQYNCGVIEFTATDSTVYIPLWILNELGLEEGSIISIENVQLPKATKIVLQTKDDNLFQFMDLKTTLEMIFKTFTCLTKDTTVNINHQSVDIQLFIKDVLPEANVLLFNTDCEVEFYVEPKIEPVTEPPIQRTLQTAIQPDMQRQADKKPLNKYSKLAKKYSAFGDKPNKLN